MAADPLYDDGCFHQSPLVEKLNCWTTKNASTLMQTAEVPRISCISHSYHQTFLQLDHNVKKGKGSRESRLKVRRGSFAACYGCYGLWLTTEDLNFFFFWSLSLCLLCLCWIRKKLFCLKLFKERSCLFWIK